ncbi:peptide deformylase [Candidatus Anaplasma sp. TIGMIC]|uniref:peptide deformylase n=1 Tax=Candidatus Anaplasma sp. TIGMIC TaxID=3020713 RepID=UPI00232DDF61|nr:peptide deformylase [Candidatus Anaplasma sp. TIGMIC]MDB1135366.1 peptide deformylase [Candidatus Anaplasma sp. TIGMIC]
MRVLSVDNKKELKVLHTISSSVEKVDSTTREIVNDMVRITESRETVGLSAIQLGYAIRVFVINMFSGLFNVSSDIKVISGSHNVNAQSLVCINPEIVSFSGEDVTLYEGCLSAKSYGLIGISRPEHVDLKYMDMSGNMCLIRAYNWLSRCIQHEMDHLRGVLLANVVDNIKNDAARSVSHVDCSSVHILILGQSGS